MLGAEAMPVSYSAASSKTSLPVDDDSFRRPPDPTVLLLSFQSKVPQVKAHEFAVQYFEANNIRVDGKLLELDPVGKLGTTFKLNFNLGFASVGVVQQVLKSIRGSSGYKQIFYDKECTNSAYFNADKNAFQRRSNKLLNKLRLAFNQYHANVPLRYDVLTGTLSSAGDTPQQLLRISFTSYNDPPIISNNSNLSWPLYDSIIGTFKSQLNIPAPAAWTS